MPVVTASRLNRYMSEPRWTPAQWQTAEQIIAGTEQDLAAALYGAVIEPQEVDEYAPLTRSGRVLTTLPIASLIAVDGVVATGGAAPAGYQLAEDGRALRQIAGAGVAVIAVPVRSGLTGPILPETGYAGGVQVHYMGGWGADPALVEAILAKAASRMDDRHSNAVGITNLDTRDAVERGPHHWTADELAPLSMFRNLGGWP